MAALSVSGRPAHYRNETSWMISTKLGCLKIRWGPMGLQYMHAVVYRLAHLKHMGLHRWH